MLNWIDLIWFDSIVDLSWFELIWLWSRQIRDQRCGLGFHSSLDCSLDLVLFALIDSMFDSTWIDLSSCVDKQQAGHQSRKPLFWFYSVWFDYELILMLFDLLWFWVLIWFDLWFDLIRIDLIWVLIWFDLIWVELSWVELKKWYDYIRLTQCDLIRRP